MDMLISTHAIYTGKSRVSICRFARKRQTELPVSATDMQTKHVPVQY